MRILCRPTSADRRSVATIGDAARRTALALGSAGILSLMLLLTPAPAGAFIHEGLGLQQRKPVWLRNAPLQYNGGPVIHSSDSYAIYWDPLELYNSQWMQLIDQYFQNVGTASGEQGDVFALNAQYGEHGYSTASAASASAKEAHAGNQSTFRGAYTDTDSYPLAGDCAQPATVVCLTDQEIKTELQKVINSGALPGATGTVPGAKSTPVYYLLTPPGVTVCGTTEEASDCSNSAALETEAGQIEKKKVIHPAETGICGYHSTINPNSATPIVYAVQPWIAGDAGLFIESESPLKTTGPTADVLACQDNKTLTEPNQSAARNPFVEYGVGLADVIIGDLADEQSNIAVDPLMNAWYQNAAAEEHGFPEQGDMCQWSFDQSGPASSEESATHAVSVTNETIGDGSYFLHWGFNSSGYITGKAGAGCWQGVDLDPHITAPSPVNVGDVIGLDANESGISLAAAPLGPRQGKEETRLTHEVLAVGVEEGALVSELAAVVAEESTLAGEIAALTGEEAKLQGEITQLGKEEVRVGTEEAKLAKERKEDEPPTKTQEEEFTKTEERLISERKRIAAAKPAAEAAKKSAEERKAADEAKKKADGESKPTIKEDQKIVTQDKVISEEEKKLAEEHRLISEREPFVAPIYRWDFGYKENGNEVTEEGEDKASVFHVFPCAKTYAVTLTIVDGGGNEAQVPGGVTDIKVEGKPCVEASSGSPAGGGGSGGSAQPTPASTGAAGGAAVAQTTPAPLATATALSHSLKSVLAGGLVIRYSVNEQVAGDFEVLLAASTARHLGLHGPVATGLAKGTPAQIVIAKSILVTTKGGRNTVKIKFSKNTAARLRRLHSVSLMVRLKVRNASPKNPATSTSISVVTLTG